jgi:uncharacterized protein (TIGR03435 family)
MPRKTSQRQVVFSFSCAADERDGQALLDRRCALQVSVHTKELAVYVLVVRENGLQRTDRKTQGHSVPQHGVLISGHGQITGTDAPISARADVLTTEIKRPVLDQTGLKDRYDFTLQWAPDERNLAIGTAPNNPDNKDASVAPTPGSTGPSRFTAIEEQLGLQLQSTKGPVKVLTIEGGEPPFQTDCARLPAGTRGGRAPLFTCLLPSLEISPSTSVRDSRLPPVFAARDCT